jgi:hypothetical protein
VEGSAAKVSRILQNDDNLETTRAIGLGTFWILDHGFYAERLRSPHRRSIRTAVQGIVERTTRGQC